MKAIALQASLVTQNCYNLGVAGYISAVYPAETKASVEARIARFAAKERKRLSNVRALRRKAIKQGILPLKVRA